MNRGERRDVNRRKWISRLKLWFNKEKWKGVGLRKPSSMEELPVDNVQDFQKTHYALKMKKSDTFGAPKKHTEKDVRARNLENRKVDMAAVSLEDDRLAWEFECGSCDFFPGDVFGTPMGIDAEFEADSEKEFSCPFADKFKCGKLSRDSKYKEFGCDHYWN